MRLSSLAAALGLAFTGVLGLAAQVPGGELRLRADTLLRVQLDRTVRLRVGAAVNGHLLDAVYLVDRSVLPAGTPVSGHVIATVPVRAADRLWQLLDGDVTPEKLPRIVFDRLTLPGGESVAMSAPATERAASLVAIQGARGRRFAPFSMARTAARQRLQDLHETYISPGRKDRLERFLFSQLPYHPQRVWRATQFDAELAWPVQIGPEASSPACAEPPQEQLPATTLHARLLTGISSRTSRTGETVEAVLTRPVYGRADGTDGDGPLLLPEGTRVSGTVIRARPARWFGRAGVLRFNLRQVTVTPEQTCAVQARAHALALNGQVTGVEAAPGANVRLDSEGQAQAGPSPNQLLAPLTLAFLLARTYSDDGATAGTGAVAGGGFGLAGRVASIASRNATVTQSFAYYALAKSLIRRFVLRGHEVEFPRNTRFEIEVTPRAGAERPMR